MKKALLIGINYKNTKNELRGCINDVYNIKDLLIKNYEYKPENIKMLCDDAIQVQPTKANIEKSMKALIENTKSGDTLLLHYSGHGTQMQDNNGDEIDGMDEVIVPLDYSKSGIISDDWMTLNIISQIPKDVNIYVFMDCCHSGTMIDLKVNINCEINETDLIHYKTTLNNKCKIVKGNVYLMSGCLDPQTSSDAFINNKNQGAFTCCLIECLSQNKKYKMKDLLREINIKLLQKNFKQRSQLSLNTEEWENCSFI